MSTTLNALAVRRALNNLDQDVNRRWAVPTPFGEDGWRFLAYDGDTMVAEILATVAQHPGVGYETIHASIVVLARMPFYDEMVLLHGAVFGKDRYAYQVFAAEEDHVNIHDGALHLWGRVDGQPLIPELAALVKEGRSI